MMKPLQYFLMLSGCLVLAACATDGTGPTPAQPAAPQEQSGDLMRASSELPSATRARTSAKAHTELGNAYMQIERYGVALDEAKAAIQADSTYASGYLLMGQVYAAQEQYALARPSFDEASRLAPGDPEIANAYGWFLCSQGQERAGIAKIEQAARNPYYQTPTRAWNNAGLCYMRLKDDAAAEERFLRAAKADDNNAAPKFYIAYIAYNSDRMMRAKQWIDLAQQKMKIVGPEVLWLAARIEKKLGNESAVKVYGEKLLKDFPGSNEYSFFSQGKFQ